VKIWVPSSARHSPFFHDQRGTDAAWWKWLTLLAA